MSEAPRRIGVEQDLVDVLDHRRVVARGADVGAVVVLVLAVDVGVLQPIETLFLVQRLEHVVGVGLGQVALDRRLELVDRRQHALDREPGGELQLVERRQRRGVGHRHRQPVADLDQRQDAVASQHLFRHVAVRRQYLLAQRVEIDDRQAVFVGRRLGRLAGRNQAGVDDVF